MLGEDSGLEVAALGGAPGVRSARYGAEGGEAIERLLRELEGVEDRRARYVCELVLIGPDGEERRGSGVLKGRIAGEPRGSEGFGYDPVFIPAGEDGTVAELGNDWKSRNSHRARAAADLRGRSRDWHCSAALGEAGAFFLVGCQPVVLRAKRQLTSAPNTITFAIT